MGEVVGVGHGRQGLDSFLNRLASLDISVVVDVRTFIESPSRPHFAPQELAAGLAGHAIQYRRIEVLSGSPERDSSGSNPRPGSRDSNDYKAHMRSSSFQAGLAAVIRESLSAPVAIMCAEECCRCHRLLHEQELTRHGIQVTAPARANPAPRNHGCH